MSKKNGTVGSVRTAICFAMLALTFLFLGVVTYEAGSAVKQVQEVSSTVFRLHIVANSDSEEDQDLKLQVRDAIGEEIKLMLEENNALTREQAIETVEDNMHRLVSVGQQVVSDAGYDYQVDAVVCCRPFPTKEYEDITLPAWDYDCLYVTIGEAVGRNWWCVLFPRLCFTDGIMGTVDQDGREYLSENLSTDAYDMITVNAEEKPARVEVRFKIVEIIQGIKQAFRK